MTQEMAREFSLYEGALLDFEAKDPNIELYMKVTAAIQNAIELEESILWKWLYYQKQSIDSKQSLLNYQWHFSQD